MGHSHALPHCSDIQMTVQHRPTTILDLPSACLANVLSKAHSHGASLQQWTDLALVCKEFDRCMHSVPLVLGLPLERLATVKSSGLAVHTLTLYMPELPFKEISTGWELLPEPVAAAEQPLFSMPADHLAKLVLGGKHWSREQGVFRPARVHQWLPRLQHLTSLRLDINSSDLPRLVDHAPPGLRQLSVNAFIDSAWKTKVSDLQCVTKLRQLTHLHLQATTDRCFPLDKWKLPDLVRSGMEMHTQVSTYLESTGEPVLRKALDTVSIQLEPKLRAFAAIVENWCLMPTCVHEAQWRKVGDTLSDIGAACTPEFEPVDVVSHEEDEMLLQEYVGPEAPDPDLVPQAECVELLVAAGRHMQTAFELVDALQDTFQKAIKALMRGATLCEALICVDGYDMGDDGSEKCDASFRDRIATTHFFLDELAAAFYKCVSVMADALQQCEAGLPDFWQPPNNDEGYGMVFLDFTSMTELEELTVRGVPYLWLPRTISRLPRLNVAIALPVPGNADHICLDHPFFLGMVHYTKITNWRSVEIVINRAALAPEELEHALEVLSATPTVQSLRISSVKRRYTGLRKDARDVLFRNGWVSLSQECGAASSEHKPVQYIDDYVRAPPALNFAALDSLEEEQLLECTDTQLT